MLLSMTGFARHEVKFPWGIAIWEIRSVNQRFLESTFRLPENLRALESTLREQLREKIARGKIESFLRIEYSSATSELTLDQNLAQQVIKSLQWLKNEAGEGEINLMAVLQYPNVVQAPVQNLEEINANLISTFEGLLQDFIAMRQREGAKLQTIVEDRLIAIEKEIAQISAQMPEVLEWQRQRLNKRFEELKVELDPNRLEQEMLILAQRIDVEEELDRLRSHIQETHHILTQGGACGRKLDFMMQEFNREANTLASKSINAEITNHAVKIKVLIEQMREQIQNIE